jgi:hypothetical protein
LPQYFINGTEFTGIVFGAGKLSWLGGRHLIKPSNLVLGEF